MSKTMLKNVATRPRDVSGRNQPEAAAPDVGSAAVAAGRLERVNSRCWPLSGN